MVYRVLMPDESGDWQEFLRPTEVLRAESPNDVAEVIMQAEAAAKSGSHVAGFVSYEAAGAFNSALVCHRPGDLPLASFGVFDRPRPHKIKTGELNLSLTPSLSRESYGSALRRVREYLKEGDTYQVNFTQQLKGQLQGEPESLMAQLFAAQPTDFGMMLETDRHAICSVSPELFFERVGDLIRTEPMKGTRPRGRYFEEDRSYHQSLVASEKDRAENLMIVDMIRNDLGRIANTGSVSVDEMFHMKALPTVWQQVSSVSARSTVNLVGIFSALFPCASVTGAPRTRTMEIIRELEQEQRGVYTGAVGVIRPGGDCRFSVAIRTLIVDKRSGQASYGVGGGIVWDSDTEDEWQEALAKSRVLSVTRPEFRLLETMRYEPGSGIQRLSYHLTRLSRSAEYFQFVCPIAIIRRQLEDIDLKEPARIRLLLNQDGDVILENSALPESSEVVRLRLATMPVNSQDVFLFHKTTNRGVYDQARAATRDCDDVLLFNEKRELTETSIANVFLEIEGRLLTPAVSCGLLAGTLRQEMLASGEATEAILTLDDLQRADRILVANSLRGVREAELLRD